MTSRSTAALAALPRVMWTPPRSRSVNSVTGYIGVREPLSTASTLTRTRAPSATLTVPPGSIRVPSVLSSMARTRIWMPVTSFLETDLCAWAG